jgi:AcrR family transcriptional regulator
LSSAAVGATAFGAVARTSSQHDRRARIVDAATALLAERDYERIQIREVADAAGVALATIYRYFPSKEQLFASVLLGWSQSFRAAPARDAQRPSTPQARVRATLRRTVRAYERNPNFFRLIIALEAVTDPAVVDLYTAFADHFGNALGHALDGVDPIDAATMASMLSALLGARLRSWSAGKTSIASVYADLDRAVELLFR